MKCATHLVLLAVICLGCNLSANAAESGSAELPQNPAQWINSSPIAVQNLSGKGVVLYFFEKGCPRCRERWPSLLETAKSYEEKPVLFIAVNSGNAGPAVASYAREVGLRWPVIVDQDRSLEKSLSVPEVSLQNIWQIVVITPEGAVQNAGADLNRAAQLAAQGAKWKVEPSSVPDELKPAWLAIELGDYAKAAPAVRKALTSPKADVKSTAEAMDAAVQQEIAESITEAQSQAEQGARWQAYRRYQDLMARYRGFRLPDELAAESRALATDPAVLAEQKAFTTLEAAKKTGGTGNPASIRRAKLMLERLIADSPDTEAAGEARAILAKLPQ